MKITLPLPPNMANSRLHWRVKNRKRKEYFEACDLAAILVPVRERALLVRRAPSIEKTMIRATVYCGALHDEDNLLARLKFPVDWMVRRGFLKDDGPMQISWYWPIEQVVKRGQDYRVEFELTEVGRE